LSPQVDYGESLTDTEEFAHGRTFNGGETSYFHNTHLYFFAKRQQKTLKAKNKRQNNKNPITEQRT